MIKDDQGGTNNPYKCMNVMKQDAMDEKIKERCKTCEKQYMQEDFDRLRSYWAKANLDGSNSYWEAIEGTESFSINRLSYREVSRLR